VLILGEPGVGKTRIEAERLSVYGASRQGDRAQRDDEEEGVASREVVEKERHGLRSRA
jgi:hypothetical protein